MMTFGSVLMDLDLSFEQQGVLSALEQIRFNALLFQAHCPQMREMANKMVEKGGYDISVDGYLIRVGNVESLAVLFHATNKLVVEQRLANRE